MSFCGLPGMPAPQSGLPSEYTPENEKLWNSFTGKFGSLSTTNFYIFSSVARHLKSPVNCNSKVDELLSPTSIFYYFRQGISSGSLARTKKEGERASGGEGCRADCRWLLHVRADQPASGEWPSVKKNFSKRKRIQTFCFFVQNIYCYPWCLDYVQQPAVKLPGNWLRIDTPVLPPYPAPYPVPEQLKDKPGKLIYFSLGEYSRFRQSSSWNRATRGSC